MRYIDAEKADVQMIGCFYGNECRLEDVQDWLDEQPTADVAEVKHGEWVWDKRYSDYTCNLCGNWDLETPNYCPNCGAKMDGKGDS